MILQCDNQHKSWRGFSPKLTSEDDTDDDKDRRVTSHIKRYNCKQRVSSEIYLKHYFVHIAIHGTPRITYYSGLIIYHTRV